MNINLFYSLLGAALREIIDRCPAYFSSNAVSAGCLDGLVSACRELALFSTYSKDQLAEAAADGLKYLAECGVPVRDEHDSNDQISAVVMQSMLDAYVAAKGDIFLRPPQIRGAASTQLLLGSYSLKKIGTDILYLLSQGTGRTLLIISSTGVPIRVWAPLIIDTDIDRRRLVVQGRGTDLIEGGVSRNSSLYEDVVDIEAVLDAEDLSEVDVIAWCNGAKVAIEAARRFSERVASLTLVAPTFHGAVESNNYPSPFEDSLLRMFTMLQKNPRHERYLMDCLKQLTSGVEQSLKKNDATRQTNDILGLPPQYLSKDIYLPLSTIESFRNTLGRVVNDESFDVKSAISEIRCPILLLIGTHDVAVNTKAAHDVLSRYAKRSLQVTISGAGHHLYALQYAYFKYVLNCFLVGAQPESTARLRVERLGT